MTLTEDRFEQDDDARFDCEPDPRWLSVVGIGDDGWDGLTTDTRDLVQCAELIVGGARHIAMLPPLGAGICVWSGDFGRSVGRLERERGRSVVVLASGDPLLYGVGVLISKTFDRREVRIIPHVSTFAQICARMVWPQVEVAQVSLCGRPVDRLRAPLGDGRKIVALSADGGTPGEVCAYLRANGYGGSTVHVFEHLGGSDEAHHETVANAMDAGVHFADLNALAIECRAEGDAIALPPVAGLPDDLFGNDGQLTKREARAVTLARLAPQPGQLLWDIGLGAGSIAIEWLRAAPGMRAIGLERHADRAARARENALRLGVAGLQVIEGDAVDVLADVPGDLDRPDAIFIGGGLTSDGIVERCWRALLPGGRLVANTVTLESEAVLFEAFRTFGGDLTRISLDRADPVGTMTGWRPAMTVTQWAVVKPREGGERA